jgi:hypothetical protein
MAFQTCAEIEERHRKGRKQLEEEEEEEEEM